MTAIPGVTLKKNSKGQLTHVTIDVRKHQEAVPVLKDLGLVPKTQFDIDCENAIPVDQVFDEIVEMIHKHYAGKH